MYLGNSSLLIRAVSCRYLLLLLLLSVAAAGSGAACGRRRLRVYSAATAAGNHLAMRMLDAQGGMGNDRGLRTSK